jgi:hypothetical protein
MAQDLGHDFAAGPTVTLLSSDLTDGSQSAWTSAVDFGAPTPVGFGFELILTAMTGSAGAVGLEVAWSHDNSDFSDDDNGQLVTTVTTTASTDKKKVGASAVMARYAKFRLDNQSGGSIDGTSSNTALLLHDIFGDQA